jgi:hypothetical protein
MNVTADPQNADDVYVMNAPIMKSIDGGRTFTTLQATHGDNHQLWINPKDSRYMANANDGGVSVSVDGGKSWSTQDNQPTAQFYHVIVDDAVPVSPVQRQQDNSSVIIKTRSDGPNIGRVTGRMVRAARARTSAWTARIRATCTAAATRGIFEELDMETGLTRQIMAWPALASPSRRTRSSIASTGRRRPSFRSTTPT